MVTTLCRPPRLPLTATSFRPPRRTRARPPSRPRRAAALRRLWQPDPLRRGRQPPHQRLLALHGGRGALPGGGAGPGRPGRGGPLPLVRLGRRRRGGPGDRRADLGQAVSGPARPEGPHPRPAPAAQPEPAGGGNGQGGPAPLPDLPEGLLAGYLDAALATLRAADQGDLPGPLRQYQTWTPKRLRHPRVLGLVRRTLDLDQSFREAVDERVLDEEEALARLVRAGRHAEALASGETPEAVARVGLALGREGEAAVQAAVAAAATSRARAEADAVRSALAGAEGELDAARERAEAEAAGARAAREELRAAREELRRVERERRTLADRLEGLERELAQSAADLRAAREEAAATQRRLGGRVAELQARLTESQRNYRALRRSAGQVDPVVAEAVGALERDLDALRRATGLATDGTGRGSGEARERGSSGGTGTARRPERRSPLAVPGG